MAAELELIRPAVAAVGAYVSLPALAKQAQDFIAAFTGHEGETIGTILGGAARERLRKGDRVIERAHLTLLNLSIPTRRVETNIWQQLLEKASLQEDETIQDRWAFLLANAADARQYHPVEPCFVDMLSHLSSCEVRFLDSVFNEKVHPQAQLELYALHSQFRKAGLAHDPVPEMPRVYSHPPVLTDRDRGRFNLMMDIIARERIIVSLNHRDGPFGFSELGFAFVKACQMPQAGATALGA